ncbi:MAG: UDP-N-acetylmuramoyl-tripeptide--D-alanyl-D-alanine ligase [Coriobacteriales bacterium]|jgi:UDP-N-acetylmuramoyl-tripeptide--D-alanyl-D-alanine ligase
MFLDRGQIIGAMDCRVVSNPVDRELVPGKVVWDSRQVVPRCAFLAVKGERVDGNDFIPQALDAGASFIIATEVPSDEIIERARENDVAIAVVEDHIKAMQQLADYSRGKMDARVVGVTGSSGKTTTKNIIAKVLGSEFKTTATAANQNNELGVPNTVLSADKDVQALVVEMGMRGFGQIENLCKFVRPDVGVITNIGVAHEELLGSQENIAKAKSELISSLPDGRGTAVLNGDDPFTPRIMEFADVSGKGISTVLFGMGGGCDVRASDVVYSKAGCPSFEVTFPDKRTVHVDLPLLGSHNVMNALAAAAVGYVLDMPVERIANALNSAKGQAGRQEIVAARNGVVVIDDTYNANPDSMRAALSLLQMMEADGRKVAVLGDMGELGEKSPEMHEEVGRLAAETGVDVLVTVGEQAEHIAAGARGAGMPPDKVIECLEVNRAIEALEDLLSQGDLVLVKASRFMELEKVVKGLVD